MDKMRLFLAVPLPDAARDALMAVQEKLVPVFGKRGRIRAESLHLTVKFLGSVPGGLVEVISAAVRQPILEIKPFQLKLYQLVTFGKPDAPRIVAALLAPVDIIRVLANEVDRACGKLGFQLEKRAFSPHVTIYRPKKSGKIDRRGVLPRVEIPVNKVILFQSELKPDGAVYRALDSFPLAGKQPLLINGMGQELSLSGAE